MKAPDGLNPIGGNPLLTRSDVEAALHALFTPLRSCFSPGGGRVRIGAAGAVFDQASSELEGFARPLWGLACTAADGGGESDWALFRAGLANGTDPAHPDYWGAVGPIDQRMVELAAIGFALCIARDRFWDPLDDAAKARVIDYLAAARAQPFSDNNWKFFRLMIDLGLEAIGVPIDAALHDAYLDEIDAFYLGDGWYRDGATEQIDHYVPFGFHFYGLLYATLASDRGERRGEFAARARLFAPQVAHWYADDGAALPFGRSLTYRFATAGFWGALAFSGVEALPWGVIKGYYLRNLRWWAGQPITGRDGLMTIGYAYPNSAIAENYNSPQSPYWAFKAFLPLALPHDHPFWTADELPPARSSCVSLDAAGMLVRHEPGRTVALVSGPSNPGIRHGAEKYAKFAYSTREAFSIESDLRQPDRAVIDGSLGLIGEDGDLRVRARCEDARISDAMLWSRWHPWADVAVETWLWWAGPWQLRLHRIESKRAFRTIEGGFAIAVGGAVLPGDSVGGAVLPGDSEAKAAIVENERLSGIVDLSRPARVARILTCEPNTNLMLARTQVPQLIGTHETGLVVLACAVLCGEQATRIAWSRPPSPPDMAALERLVPTMRRVPALLNHPDWARQTDRS